MVIPLHPHGPYKSSCQGQTQACGLPWFPMVVQALQSPPTLPFPSPSVFLLSLLPSPKLEHLFGSRLQITYLGLMIS